MNSKAKMCLSLTFIAALILSCTLVAQEKVPGAEPRTISDTTKAQTAPQVLNSNEILMVQNIALRVQNVSTQLELLVERHRRFSQMQNELAKEQAVVADELLKAHGLDAKEWFFDWRTLEIKKREPTPETSTSAPEPSG